jgi:dihydrofolate reductase
MTRSGRCSTGTARGPLARFPDAPFHTTDSLEAGIALAKEIAGGGLVCVTAGDVGGQAFSAGLVDEVAMDVVPVVMGEGSKAGSSMLPASIR